MPLTNVTALTGTYYTHTYVCRHTQHTHPIQCLHTVRIIFHISLHMCAHTTHTHPCTCAHTPTLTEIERYTQSPHSPHAHMQSSPPLDTHSHTPNQIPVYASNLIQGHFRYSVQYWTESHYHNDVEQTNQPSRENKDDTVQKLTLKQQRDESPLSLMHASELSQRFSLL